MTRSSSHSVAVACGIPALLLSSSASFERWESIQVRENPDRVSMIFVTDLRSGSSSHVLATERLSMQTCWL